jgi:hypothetical protein
MKNQDVKSPAFYAGSIEAAINAVANFLDDVTTEGETDDGSFLDSDDSESSQTVALLELLLGRRIKALLDALPGVEIIKDVSRLTRLLTSIFKYCPGAPHVRDSSNCSTILHFAIMDHVDLDCLQFLCQVYPEP